MKNKTWGAGSIDILLRLGIAVGITLAVFGVAWFFSSFYSDESEGDVVPAVATNDASGTPAAVEPPDVEAPLIVPDPVIDVKPEPKPRELPGEVVGTAITAENIFNGVNEARYNAGLPILKRNPVLDAAAKRKLDDMRAKNYFAHDTPDGMKPWIFFEGYEYKRAGENLAHQFDTVQETVDGWIASPTHYANIVKPEYTETGIAVDGDLVVQFFATPL